MKPLSAAAHPMKRWLLPRPVEEASLLARELQISDVVANLLWQRGYQSAETASSFLEPRLADLGDPFLLTGLRVAAERLVAALAHKERIVIFGDYDVDGITSTALLARVLTRLGGLVSTFLPGRMIEGYGLSRKAAERCVREYKPQLLVAVDCGTSSATEIAWLRQQGVAVIVIDHHELPESLPICEAFVNPHQDGDYLYLCTVGLVFKLCHGLLKAEPAFRDRVDLRHYLDLVALGTIADIVPLRGDNRIYVRAGLAILEKTRHPGLKALCEVAGLKRTPRPDDVGFRLAPRLNASGRLDDANESLRLLLTDDPAEANLIALSLDAQNRERQQLEARIYDEALELLGTCFDHEQDWAIVLGSRGWHVGVIGIVAARFQRLFYRPTIIIGFDQEGVGKGSGRSIEGCSLVEGLRASSDFLDQYGGHEMAAGLSLQESSLVSFRETFHRYVKQALCADQLQPRLQLSGELDIGQVGEKLFNDLELLAPFGRENPQPVFAFPHVRQRRSPQTIKNHLKLFLQGETGSSCEAMGFGFAERSMPDYPLSLAGVLEWDDYSNRVQLRLVDWQATSS